MLLVFPFHWARSLEVFVQTFLGQCLAVVYPSFLDSIGETKIEKFVKIAWLFDPSLYEVNDKTAALQLKPLMINFLDAIDLNKIMSDLGVSKDELNKTGNSFLLNVLPRADKDILFEMISSRF